MQRRGVEVYEDSDDKKVLRIPMIKLSNNNYKKGFKDSDDKMIK